MKIQKNLLFQGMDGADIQRALKGLSAAENDYKKNSIIFEEGDRLTSFGIVKSGIISVERYNYDGQRGIITRVSEGDTFGEVFASGINKQAQFAAFAAEDSTVIWISVERLLALDKNFDFQQQIIKNFICIMAEKNLVMNEKLRILSRKNTRDKILAYLSLQQRKQGGKIIEIPLNREQLADYLFVDRSSLSRELSLMKEEKIIDFEKNKFVFIVK